MTVTINGSSGLTANNGSVFTDASGNVGIGTGSPTAKLQVSGNAVAANFAFGTTTAAAGTIGADTGFASTSPRIVFYGSTSGGAGQLELYSGNAPMVLSTNNAEHARIDSTGNFSITQTPGKYTIDTNGGATSIANNGTVDFSNASGMLVVNSHNTGGVTLYLCGGGTTYAVASVIGQIGTLSYVSGINGYRWTNNSGGTATFGFFFVRTRGGA